MRQLIIAATLAMSSSSFGATLEVCPSGCAYTSIQDAIDDANNGDVVFIYPGVYYEQINFDGKAITVSGSGADVTTIDGYGSPGSVVTFAQGEGVASVLEDVHITNGSGTIFPDPIFGDLPCGGGIFLMGSSPVIHACRLTNNTCWGGAGMFNFMSSPDVEQCTFSNNIAEGHGGGSYNLNYSSPNFTECTFEGNDASWGGGVTNTVDCEPKFTNCMFTGNTVFNVGGGMFNRSRSSPTVVGCSFIDNLQTGNPVGSGAGMCTYGSGNGGGPCYPILTNCHFEGNSVTGDGAGMANAYDAHPTVTDCTFVDNHAGRNGGGMACMGNADPYVPANAIVTNCTFIDNSTDQYGGGFHSRSSTPTVRNCHIEANSAGLGGGGAGFENSDLAELATTTLCGNSPDNLFGLYFDGGGNSDDAECLECDGDLNGDELVNVNDLLLVIGDWGNPYTVDDLLLVIANWGSCP
ncbi:MAG: hypothetical protein MK095_08215 [Phycisphaerales bacterium]|nr:hypothetical protein [Phycisphaerales bacterium]